jgi:hypothetical protein
MATILHHYTKNGKLLDDIDFFNNRVEVHRLWDDEGVKAIRDS